MRVYTSLSMMLALVVMARAGELEFVRGGKPIATIIVASDAPPPERFAAEELQGILATMSGAKLPIVHDMPANADAVVLIGVGAARLAGGKVLAASQLDDVEEDGYAITSLLDNKPPSLALLGKKPRGTLFAVYDFLQTYLGCGFFHDGDNIPRRLNVAVIPVSNLGNPAFRTRAVYVPTNFYAPKRFQATLWNETDWKAYLHWMAKEKMNCLVVDFTGASRAWGNAFDKAFPEIKDFKRETLPGELATETSKYTARLGWGLSPDYITELRQKVFDYARTTLGMEIVYLFHMGQFEQPLRLAHPNYKWLSPGVARLAVGVRSGTACLDAADPHWEELQSHLIESIVKTYGKADYYCVSVQSQPEPGASGPYGPDLVTRAINLVKKVDKDAAVIIPTWDSDRWGAKATDKTTFLSALPPEVTILYFDPNFAIVSFHVNVQTSTHTIYWATRQFENHPFIYGSQWGGGAANDLFENRFDSLINVFRHYTGIYYPKSLAPTVATRRVAVGCTNWNDLRDVNPLMDNLTSEFCWTGLLTWRGEGAASNPFMKRYLARRYIPPAAFALSEAYKQIFRGAPFAEPDANYRAYAIDRGIFIDGIGAARAGIALMLAVQDAAKQTPFYEPDLVDFGRDYLMQVIHARYANILRMVRAAKAAAKAKEYTEPVKNSNLDEFKKLEAELLNAEKTLTRLIATRQDMSLDDAILDASATPGANKNLGAAVREQQSGIFADGYCLVDSIEYHQELKAKQMAHFLDYARKELAGPTDEPVPSWRDFFLFGATDFIEKTTPTPYKDKAEKTAPSKLLEEFLKSTQ